MTGRVAWCRWGGGVGLPAGVLRHPFIRFPADEARQRAATDFVSSSPRIPSYAARSARVEP
jgi:hypothetical protein